MWNNPRKSPCESMTEKIPSGVHADLLLIKGCAPVNVKKAPARNGTARRQARAISATACRGVHRRGAP
ncbi:hypothetical protein X941_5830 [Burkholderia pseudomallei MSHR5569]|nr:hypothetical protein X941_5830 [Burkholderia pseudomallei MSHR5569]